MSLVKKFETLSVNEKMFLNVFDRKHAFLDYKKIPVMQSPKGLNDEFGQTYENFSFFVLDFKTH